MNFATVLDLGILGTPDSEEMWSNIIDQIQIKPGMKFLNVAAGHGTEAKLLARHLVASGHYTQEQALDSIYVLDNYLQFTQPLKRMGFKNVITADFLQWESNMHFNVVIGNPPYQDSSSSAKNVKLWKAFTDNVVKMNPDVIAFITPNGAFKKVDSNGKRCRDLMKEHNYGVVQVKNHEVSPFHGIGVDTCQWIISKDSNEPIDNHLFNFTNPLAQSICDKVVSYSQKLPLRMDNGHISRNELTESGKNKILFSGKKVSHTDKNITTNGLKLVFPFSSSYHSAFVTEEATGQLNLVMNVSDQEEADFILSYTMSPLFKLVANTYRKTSGFTPFVKNVMIPDLRKKDITNLYNTFNLTQEEIDYVERNSK